MSRIAAIIACCAFWVASQQLPYRKGVRAPATYEGPGRELPEPDAPDVAIGYYGPADASHLEGGMPWQGASLAIEELNREGGYRGKPFRLVARWSEDPWRAGASMITQMAFVDRVWAVVGSIEGAGTHLAEQVAAKALLPLVNPVATDRSIHMAGVPWMFSIVQGDDQHAAVLARALHGRKIVVLAATDHDSRTFCGYLKPACEREKARVDLLREFEPGRGDLSRLASDAMQATPEAVVILAGTTDSARLVRMLRSGGFKGAIAGGPLFGRAGFAGQAGAAAEGAIFPWVGEVAPAFRAAFTAGHRHEPDYAAACTYDAVRAAGEAVRKAGLNRARIRDAIADRQPWEGASGRVEWDAFGQNRRAPVLAAIRSGRPAPFY
jgi:branched-chain amino acid transport system substrate-binding protein